MATRRARTKRNGIEIRTGTKSAIGILKTPSDNLQESATTFPGNEIPSKNTDFLPDNPNVEVKNVAADGSRAVGELEASVVGASRSGV